jgi:lysozyme family protein
MNAPSYSTLAPEYREHFATCAPQPATRGEREAALLLTHRDRYTALAHTFPNQLPWFAIGLIHLMEADADFGCHLHNGDPLGRRTVHEPAGRPPGQPPFTWEQSARDALTQARWPLVPAAEWADVAGVLYQLEAYNGWGPRLYHQARTAYLWAGSNLEQPGKYVTDGHWSSMATSAQTGAAVILKRLVTGGAVSFPAVPVS